MGNPSALRAELTANRCTYYGARQCPPGKATCCIEHARKVAGRRAAETRARNKVWRDRMEALQARLRFVPKWRQMSMGEIEPAELEAIFGTRPHPDPPRHGETLDV